MIERLNREIRRRTCIVEIFPDGNSVLVPVCAMWPVLGGTTKST